MVEFPPYIKLVQGNSVRKTESVSRTDARKNHHGQSPVCEGSDQQNCNTFLEPDVVNLIARENQQARENDVPTALEAEEALRKLEAKLPGLGQGVGDIHSGLDRRIILSLLAPLVE